MDPFAARRRRYASVLGVVGVAESFARLPRWVQEYFWRMKSADPAVEYGQGFPHDRALRRDIESSLRAAEIAVDGRTITVRDFVGVIIACRLAAAGMAAVPKIPPEIARFSREAGAILETFQQAHFKAAFISMYRAIQRPLIEASRLDQRILTARPDWVTTERGKGTVRIMLDAVPADVRHVRIDGAVRPLYRVTGAPMPAGIDWVAWKGELVARPEWGETVPVYVQAHALRQLQQRVNLPGARPYLQTWLAESMSQPRIVRRRGDELLVEYRIHENRLGYLIATPIKDAAGPLIAVRTFLFLTMSPSPESRLLERRLRLSRRDAHWLGLHDLAAFTQTDLRDDPVLRPMLEACGCGHLFALAEDGIAGADVAPQPKALAGEMKKYLRMAA